MSVPPYPLPAASEMNLLPPPPLPPLAILFSIVVPPESVSKPLDVDGTTFGVLASWLLTHSALGDIILDGHVAQGQVALIINRTSFSRHPRTEGQTALHRQALLASASPR